MLGFLSTAEPACGAFVSTDSTDPPQLSRRAWNAILSGGYNEAMQKKFELVFVGGAQIGNMIPRYCRDHRTLESAQETAKRVFEKMQQLGIPKTTAIVYGPKCGKDGK